MIKQKLEELSSLSINDHYMNRYIKMILHIVDKTVEDDMIYEKHHILPKCLFPEYSDFEINNWNLAYVTPKCHYVLHKLLALCIGGKMIYAFNMMANCRSPTQERKYDISSSDYELLKIMIRDFNPSKDPEVKKIVSEKAKLRWNDPEFRRKMDQIFSSPEYKIKSSRSNSESWDDEKRLKQSKRMKERWSDEEYYNYMCEQSKLSWTDERKEEHIIRMTEFWTDERKKEKSDAMSGKNNHFYGQVHTEETRKKISSSNMGRTNSQETRDKISKANKGKSKPDGFGEVIRNRLLGKERSQETKDKISKKAKERAKDKDYIKKQSEAQKNRKRDRCIYCDKEMDICNLKKYHNERCKFK